MSAKISLYYTDHMHLYAECTNSDSVFLKVSQERVSMLAEMTIEEFAKIAGTFDLSSLEKQAGLTDEQIMDYCTKWVERRKSQNIAAILGCGIFGSASAPHETQVKNGFEHFVAKRNKLRSMLDDIKDARTSKMSFGLESLVSISYEE